MSIALWHPAATVIVLGAFPGAPVAAQQALFSSDTIVELRLEAPFAQLTRRDAEGRQPGRLIVPTGTGADTLSVSLSPRGKSRVNAGICTFPGFMLHFDSPAPPGSLFAGQGDLPLTTHCNTRSTYEQFMLLEYLAYRLYNVVTDLSLQTRLARIHYYDDQRNRTVATKLAFFLEHWDDLANRTGWDRVSAPVIPPDEYDERQRNLFEVFQYLIGNTDWSFAYPPPDEAACCHNTVPIGNSAGPVFPVPFDFDQAGLVDPPYARPDPSLGIRRVRDRRYWGICSPPDLVSGTLALFVARRRRLYAVFEDEALLDARSRTRSIVYLDQFYDATSRPERLLREFERTCRTPG